MPRQRRHPLLWVLLGLACALTQLPAAAQANGAIYTVKKTHPGEPASAPAAEPPAAQPAAPSPAAAPPAPAPTGNPLPANPPSSATGPAPAPRPPAAAGAAGPANAAGGEPVTDVILRRQLGSAGFQQLMNQLQSMGSVPGDTGQGAPMANTWFDGARLRTGDDDGLRPSGTPFFQGHFTAPPSQPAPPVTSGSARPATPQDAQQTLSRYQSIPGGVVLEGTAAGLGDVSAVQYDRRFNALIFNRQFAYFMRVPPAAVATLCRAMAEDPDEKIGVSIGNIQLIYGKAPEDSEVVWDLKMADNFLGDIVFAENDWTNGYRFANGYVPQPYHGTNFSVAVFFVFDGFQFAIRQQALQPVREEFLARLFPLTDKPTPDGGLEPDEAAIARGQTFPEFQQNAQHIAANIDYYRREKIVDRMFAYGEVAAVLRELKRQGFDLEDLADHVPHSQ